MPAPRSWGGRLANRRTRPITPNPSDGAQAPARGEADAGELFRLLLDAQNAQLDPRHRPRRAIRARRALPVEVTWEGKARRGVTLDFGEGGFAVLLAEAPPREAVATAALSLSRRERISCAVRVVAARERRGSARISFAFEGMTAEDAAKLRGRLVGDAVSELAITPLPR